LPAHQKAADYTIARTRLGAIETIVEMALLLALTFGGGIAALVRLTDVLPFGGMARDLALIVAVAVVSGLLAIPFSYYRTFGVEVKFGFNRTTRALWFADLVKGTLIGALLGLPLAAVVLWLMRATGPYWWLWAWAVWIGFQFLLLALYPTVIAPLFNKFSPLPAGAARAAIEALLARCGFENRGLYVMDGSRRSSHGNAFFTGFGRAKRIVFFDTLLERLAPDEVEAVLAHELGHFKLKHVLKRMLWTAFFSLAFLGLLAWLAGSPWFYEGLGVPAFDGSSRRRADPVLPRAAGVHVRVRAAVGVLFAPARVRSGRVRGTERFRDVARPRAREALRRQRLHADARPRLLGVPRLASAGRRPHRAPGDGMTDRLRELVAMHCRAGAPRLPDDELHAELAHLPGWTRSGERIEKTFRFGDYHATIAFVNAVAAIAHIEDHHPDLGVHYDRCVVAWSHAQCRRRHAERLHLRGPRRSHRIVTRATRRRVATGKLEEGLVTASRRRHYSGAVSTAGKSSSAC
jgi:Zn-dependent protease with chaperone function/pterin-4a-carbinolamine dehydratase